MTLIREFFQVFARKNLVKTTLKKIWIDLPTRAKLYAHIHTPVIPGKYPGIIFVPGGFATGTDYDRGGEVSARDVASMGFTVLNYDPSGRGRSKGEEDNWGPAHQKELAMVIDFFSKLPYALRDNIGILSFSIGIVIASGALARFSVPKVSYLFDWEGPSNRFNATKNDTYEPVADFPTSDSEFWEEREAAKFIGNIECGYFRYQAEKDHVQGDYKGHAIEMLNRATEGKAAWTKCNDNPLNTLFDENKVQQYNWVTPNLNNKKQILKYLLEIQKEVL